MDDTRDHKFAAWIEAERTAYEAIHRLNQSTQGGRLAPTEEAIAAVVALRREANNRLAQLSNRVPNPAKLRRPEAPLVPIGYPAFARQSGRHAAPQQFAR